MASILVVDDIPENVELLFRLLTKRGYNVRSAGNGEAALQSVRKDPPDLILLDIDMPDIAGYEVAARLNPSSTVNAEIRVSYEGSHRSEVKM